MLWCDSHLTAQWLVFKMEFLGGCVLIMLSVSVSGVRVSPDAFQSWVTTLQCYRGGRVHRSAADSERHRVHGLVVPKHEC